MIIRLLLVAVVWVVLGAKGTSAQAATTRELMPWTFSGAASTILPSVGVDLSRQLNDRIAIGVQVTQLLTAHVDVSFRLRLFLIAGETSGIYLGANSHLWYSPLILDRVSPVATGELGYEVRRPSGFTFGIGLGAGGIFERTDEGVHTNRVEPLLLINVRIGGSWGS